MAQDLEALWSVEFASSTRNFGAGVVVFETGRLFGGDSSYFYVGAYSVGASGLEATVQIKHYFGQYNSIFGSLDEYTLKFRQIAPESRDAAGNRVIQIAGELQGSPGQLVAQLTWRAALPG